MKKCLLLIVCMACASSTFAQSRPAGPPGRRAAAQGPGWFFGIQLYPFNKLTFVEAVDRASQAGVRVVEGFAWQKISADTGDAQLNDKAPPEAIDKAVKKLGMARMFMIGCYISDWGKDEAEARKLFDFAKKMRIQTLVGEPDAKLLPMLDKVAQEYGIRIAFHNHFKDPAKPDYKNWDPDQVMAMLKPYSHQIGICADTGHLLRSGLDPVEGLKKYQGRLISLHIKDVNEKGEKGHDVILGTGVGNVKGQLEELKRQNFHGLIAIEYESESPDALADVKKSVDFLRTTARELGVMPGADVPNRPPGPRGPGRGGAGRGYGGAGAGT
jgi:L-ribulose-5-phosphate 3-epimerase